MSRQQCVDSTGLRSYVRPQHTSAEPGDETPTTPHGRTLDVDKLLVWEEYCDRNRIETQIKKIEILPVTLEVDEALLIRNGALCVHCATRRLDEEFLFSGGPDDVAGGVPARPTPAPV